MCIYTYIVHHPSIRSTASRFHRTRPHSRLAFQKPCSWESGRPSRHRSGCLPLALLWWSVYVHRSCPEARRSWRICSVSALWTKSSGRVVLVEVLLHVPLAFDYLVSWPSLHASARKPEKDHWGREIANRPKEMDEEMKDSKWLPVVQNLEAQWSNLSLAANGFESWPNQTARVWKKLHFAADLSMLLTWKIWSQNWISTNDHFLDIFQAILFSTLQASNFAKTSRLQEGLHSLSHKLHISSFSSDPHTGVWILSWSGQWTATDSLLFWRTCLVLRWEYLKLRNKSLDRRMPGQAAI